MNRGEPESAADSAAGSPRRTSAPLLLIAAILFGLALIGILVARAGLSNAQRDRALARERHSYEVMLAARSIQASMTGAEAALGRYAIATDQLMGSIYYANWTRAGAQITRLRTLVGTDPNEVQEVDRLATLYAARGRELAPAAAVAARHDGAAALALFSAAARSPRVARIAALLESLRVREIVKLGQRYDQSDAAAADAGALIRLLALTGLALLVAAGWLGWAVTVAVARRRRAEAAADEAADRTAWLREAVAERTGALSEANARLEAEMAERATAEAKLRQMHKMEAVGQLTGGIAHDFNNMLAVVIGGLELAQRRIAPGHAAAAPIDRAIDGAERAAALTRRLLGFARAERLLPERVDACALIADMAELVDRALGERVTVEMRADAGCWSVFVDPLQLQNAILNMALNARDAIDGDGHIVITSGNATLGQGEIGQLPAGQYAIVAVSDDGRGMSAEVMDRVFEPFFTTKPAGQGTGLGLSQVFGFVRQSGGDVAIHSAPGRGTTVQLYLPRAAAAEPARPSAEIVPIAAATPTPDGRTVLLVEDDPRVRMATAGALDEIGYRVIACDGGAEALAALEAEPDIAVMVTDVVMPGMTGPELAQAVRIRYPAIQILFVTGYAGGEGDELVGEAVLRKPFTIVALERAVGDTFGRVTESGRAPRAAAAG